MFNRPLVLPAFCLVAALAAPRARADVVLNESSSRAFLFFEESGVVHRAACPPGTRFFDRDTCAVAVQAATRPVLVALFRQRLGGHLTEFTTSLTQVWTQVQAIDLKLAEIQNREPTGAPQVTQTQLDAAERRLAQARADGQELKDQGARIELALVQDPHDLELRAQLQTTRAAAAVKQKAENEALAALDALRAAYVQERGSSREQDYAELVTLRVARSAELKKWRREVDEEIVDLERGETLLTRLLDHSFAWPMGVDPGQVAPRFERAFIEAEEESRTLHVRASERFRARFTLADERVVANVKCRLSTPALRGVQWRFLKLKGDVIEADALIKFDGVPAGLFAVDFGQQGWTRAPLIAGGFLNRASPGAWEVAFHYLEEPTSPAPEPVQALSCALIFAR